MKKNTEMKSPSSSSTPDITASSDMKDVIKVVLLRVANKTTSRYGVTLFLFCSSVWLLTQAFLALHNGCWISNPEILSRIKEKTRDCAKTPDEVGSREQDFGKQHVHVAVNDLDVYNPENGDKKAVLDVRLNVRSGVEKAEQFAKPHETFVQGRETEREKRSEEIPIVDDSKTTSNIVEDERRANASAGKQLQDPKGDRTQSEANDNVQFTESSQPTKKPYRPLPFGSGVPALQPAPYKLPANTSMNVLKITKESWETMGCIQRVTIFIPGVKHLPKDHLWKEVSESFKKYRMGYYLLKCPEQVCDLIVRTGATASSIVSGSAVLVGATTRLMKNKTKAIMQDVKRLTPDNLLKIYLFTLDNSPMMNHYEPYIANFEYHYSMTYHSQADVPIPYGRFRAGVGAQSQRNWAEGKTSLVAWVEDNCDKTFWPRLEYVYELRKHIPVDIYGRCGNMTCASTHCQEELKSYKFYLALEEAPCEEFITMGFWQRAVLAGAVPIVYGGKNYSYAKVAPPNSFIHIADFNSPAELAHSLLRLSASDAEYNRFHEWRTKGSVELSGPGLKLDSLCHMVPQLIHVSPPRRKVMSRGKFYRSCRKGIYVNGFSSRGDLSNWTPWR